MRQEAENAQPVLGADEDDAVLRYGHTLIAAWSVRRIFGYPGDGINSFIAALDEHQKQHADARDAIEFVHTSRKNPPSKCRRT